MRNIGIIHYKAGATDGVSLEIDKWKQVLEEMGHRVHLCAGDLGTVEGTLIEEIFHHRPEVETLYRNTFIALNDYDEHAYAAELKQRVEIILPKLRAFIEDKQIDFLIPQNVWSVAASPALAIALTKIMREFQLVTVAHNHDFYWERVDGAALTCAPAIELAQKYLPPRDRLASHVVINSLAQRELKARKGIESIVVPNVFDFDAPAWLPDDYNADFRRRIGLKENDLYILQATRIVPRKGIELAIEFVQALNQPERRKKMMERGLYDGRPFGESSRIVLVLAGYTSDDVTGQYPVRLKRKIAETGIDAVFIEDIVGGRRSTRDGERIYSLWDTYVYADFVTYPSLWEGWGNQLLEAIRARLPFLLFEYPVYEADIKSSGLKAVSLGSEIQGRDSRGLAQVRPEVIQAAADQAVALLTDEDLRRQTVEHNFLAGKRHYSLATLHGYLAALMSASAN